MSGFLILKTSELIFPEKINGKYYALHRPSLKSVGDPEIWIAESTNLIHWGNHQHLLGLRSENRIVAAKVMVWFQ